MARHQTSSQATLAVSVIRAGLSGSLDHLRWEGRSDQGRDKPSPINTSCMAIKAPASSTQADSRKVVQMSPWEPKCLLSATQCCWLPLDLYPGRSHP